MVQLEFYTILSSKALSVDKSFLIIDLFPGYISMLQLFNLTFYIWFSLYFPMYLLFVGIFKLLCWLLEVAKRPWKVKPFLEIRYKSLSNDDMMMWRFTLYRSIRFNISLCYYGEIEKYMCISCSLYFDTIFWISCYSCRLY